MSHNRQDYKRVIGKLEPHAGFEARMAAGLQSSGGPKRPFRAAPAVVAACLVAALGVGLLANQFGSEGVVQPIASSSPGQAVTGGSVAIPKLVLSTAPSKVSANMIGLVVYQGRIYTQSATRMAPEAAKGLLGEKLCRTKAGITEWSTQEDYAKELASTIGTMDVYAVKGYDRSFRIMAYEELNGEIVAEFYECLNGIDVRSGADVFGPMKLADTAQTARWLPFESWDSGQSDSRALSQSAALSPFLLALNQAKPIAGDTLQSVDIYDNTLHPQQFLQLTLKDGSVVQLRLFKEGYVKYGSTDVFFQVDAAAFAKMWEALK